MMFSLIQRLKWSMGSNLSPEWQYTSIISLHWMQYRDIFPVWMQMYSGGKVGTTSPPKKNVSPFPTPEN